VVEGLKWLGAMTVAAVLVAGLMALWGFLTILVYVAAGIMFLSGFVYLAAWKIRRLIGKK